MEIRVLRYFLAVAREESITKAAEVLHITQSTLSRQISQLEEGMGVRLLERGTRKVTLTEEGLLLKRRAEEKEIAQQEKNVGGVVSVGCGDLAAVQILPDIFRRFHEHYRQLHSTSTRLLPTT